MDFHLADPLEVVAAPEGANGIPYKEINHSDLVYFDEPILYWDSSHSAGQNY